MPNIKQPPLLCASQSQLPVPTCEHRESEARGNPDPYPRCWGPLTWGVPDCPDPGYSESQEIGLKHQLLKKVFCF